MNNSSRHICSSQQAPIQLGAGDARLVDRREFLWRFGGGLGGIAMAHLLGQQGLLADAPQPKAEFNGGLHHRAKAKRVVQLFMSGAASQCDTFDYKPALIKRHGEKFDPGGKVELFQSDPGAVMKSPWDWKQYGQCGKWISDLVPHIGSCADDLAFVHSMMSKSNVHGPATFMQNTGFVLPGFPAMGAWISYGLGSLTDNLPTFVVLPDVRGLGPNGASNWSAGFLPAVHQGTLLRPGAAPILHLKPPPGVSPARQRATLDLLQQMNELDTEPGDSEMGARISSYELAFRMQSHAPEAVDLTKEPEHIRRMYGLDRQQTAEFGSRCLLARRMVERGVRFVQIYSGGGPVSVQWDAHKDLKENHEKMCGMTDQPVAALLKDLKQRGLLDSTLVIWGSEFGRLPMSQSGNGRDHNMHGFTMWFAGGGTKGGRTIGETDDFGIFGVGDRYPMRDFHATVLQMLGLDQHKLWYLHNGRNEKLTDFGGKPIERVYS